MILQVQPFYLTGLGDRVGGYGEIAYLQVLGRDRPPRWQSPAEDYDGGAEASYRHEGFQGSGRVSEAEK
jgi:hypothetical protein